MNISCKQYLKRFKNKQSKLRLKHVENITINILKRKKDVKHVIIIIFNFFKKRYNSS